MKVSFGLGLLLLGGTYFLVKMKVMLWDFECVTENTLFAFVKESLDLRNALLQGRQQSPKKAVWFRKSFESNENVHVHVRPECGFVSAYVIVEGERFFFCPLSICVGCLWHTGFIKANTVGVNS